VVDLVDVLDEICAQRLTAAAHAVSIARLPADDDVSVPASDAALIGALVGEAIANAIQYAHPAGVRGRITVACERDVKGRTRVTVTDDGVGLPENFDSNRDGRAGFKMMRALSEKLRATLTCDSSPLGLSVLLCLPASQPAATGSAQFANGVSHALNSASVQKEFVQSGRAAKGAEAHTEALEALPVPIYITDAKGRITFYNEAAAAFWGCRPELGKSEFCGSWKLYHPDGRLMPHAECPMAVTLSTKAAVRGAEAVALRPDGSKIPFIPYPTPLFDETGELVGAINMLMDISERKRAEASLAKHRDEQTALYELTDQLFRTGSLNDACEAALDAIGRALGCERASILLADDTGVMRFVAWRGLSDGYRNAVEGHSPWAPDVKEPEPVCVSDVETADLSDDLRAVVAAEGIGALAFIPIIVQGGLAGKFMTYYPASHIFKDEEIDLALTIARQFGFGVERVRAEHDSRLLRAIIESSDAAIVSKDVNGIITSWNEGAERVFGHSADEIVGKSVLTLIPPERHGEESDILNRIRAGERIDHYETVRQRKDGSLVDVSLTVSPLRDVAGNVVGASKIAQDITERKEAQLRQDMLAREVQHRTKNLFAVVQAVVARSFVGKSSVEDAQAAVLDRLGSLAQTHALLMDKQWQGASLADVVNAEMSPYAGRVQIGGPDLLLSATAAQNFSLALHELATNAAKYGALSTSTGRVAINWSVSEANGEPWFTFRWQESGGPAVSTPARSGFGTTVLESVMAEYFEETPRIEFAAEGVSYEIKGSLGAVAADENSHPAGETATARA
jgi:PAS domain S-box-containing protein